MMKFSSVSFFFISGLCLSSYSSVVSSLELGVDLYTGADYSNNVSLASTNTEDDFKQILGLNVLVKEERKRFNADASFNLEREHYYNNTFSDQTSLTTGFGIFNFDLVEDFLDWRTSFTRTQVLNNTFDNDTPDNREQRNILRTGPTMTYRVSRSSTVSTSANYTLVENSDDEASDTKRVTGNLTYGYSVNNTTSLSLNTVYDEIIDGDGSEELTNSNINVGMKRLFSHGQLNFNYGVTKTRSDIAETVTGNFFDIGFTREQFFWHSVNLQYREDLSDTSIGFANDEEGFQNENGPVDGGENSNGENQNLQGVSSKIDIVTRKQFNMQLSRVLGSYQYVVSGFWRNEKYQILEEDSKSRGFSLGLNKSLTTDLELGVSYSYSLNDYFDQPLIGKERTGSYRFNSTYAVTRSLNLSGNLQYAIRMNSRNQVREYEEFSTAVSLTWKLL